MEPPDLARPRRGPLPLAAWVAAVVAGCVAAVQLREGVLQILDTASYLSGAQAIRDGHPFTSTIAPSFSNFTSVEFLDRGGRLPFVDFPAGYSGLAGLVSFVVGARPALGLIVVVATAALGAAIVVGPRRPVNEATYWIRAAFAIFLVGMPVYRLVVQGVLSEPVVVAVLVAFAATLIRYRETGDGLRLAAVLGATLGLLRFLGGPLAVFPAIEHYRRHRRAGTAVGLAGLCLLPTAINVIWAGAVGGGHTTTWHGIDRRDIKLVGRSVSGLVDASTGDLARTLLKVGDQLPWWGYPLTAVWLGIILVSGAQFAGVSGRRRLLPATLELPFVVAGTLTVALLAGIAAFDALATPDNRIMLPAGILSLCALVWGIDVTGRRALGALAVVGLWAVVAVRPWDVGHLFTQPDRLAAARAYEDIDASVVITNDADGLYFLTGIPSAYLPPERMALTDEPVDRSALFEELPCALAENDGAVIVFPSAMFGVLGQVELDGLVSSGRLTAEVSDDGTVYRAAESLSC